MRVTAVLVIALCALSMASARREGPEGSLEAKESDSEKRAPASSTGAAADAEKARAERETREAAAKEKEEEEATKLHRRPGSATGGAAGMVSNDDDEDKRERPAVVPYGKSFLIFNLQLEGPSQLSVVNAEKEIAAAIASSFDRKMGVSAEHVIVEAVNELIPVQQSEDEAALLELGADQLTTNVRVRVEVPKEHIENATKEVKSMAGAELQAKLQQNGLNAEITLRGDPEVVSEPQGPQETGAAAGPAAPLLALAAVALAAAGQQRW